MRAFYFLFFVTAFIVLFGLLEVILLKLLNRAWYDRQWIRRAAWSLPLVGSVAFVLWAVCEYNGINWLVLPLAMTAALTFILEVSLMLTLPVSGLIHLANHILEWISSKQEDNEQREAVDSVRRDLLRGLAAAVPLTAIAGSAGGVTRSFGSILVEPRVMTFPQLPTELEGIRIAHVSDLHLHNYVNLDDLELLMTDLADHRPDLICLIGDIADDLTQLPDALRMVSELRPRLGVVATLGNHEYFRGIDEVYSIYQQSSIPLLIDQHLRLEIGNSTLYVGGIDDPRGMAAGNRAFFTTAIERTFASKSTDDFTLLLSHRPDAFPYAAERDISLSLAGHTHGGQMGFAGRSILESWLPNKFLWGEYQIDGSKLYTSSGAGHWFPFRLGCPPEAPVIELRRA